ncbi:beta-propeller fold lactonase family protein [Granulicella sp. WH15]|uniref:YncE family protein n=1 Tax=Granulicella sp. WH15 TaxID=2602070 RepID=UPI001366EBD3|nr:YncE family protein [Granulicella sp. WH15]QHN03844.1 beta-propeller fold lactonase family protein [Granulicella sp. WH15]
MPHLSHRNRRALRGTLLCLLLPLAACSRKGFPRVPDGYREYAYVSNTAANTVSVLDLVYLRPERTLLVGAGPSGMAVNPVRNEVYVVNTQPSQPNGSVSVIDVVSNRVVATILVHRLPYSIAVDPTGHRAFVANSGSNTVSVLDLDKRRLIHTAATGEQPGVARISPDGRTLVVTNRGSNSVSVYSVAPTDSPTSEPALRLRSTFDRCPGATDAAILPDSLKAFIACSSGHQVMAISLAAAPDSWQAKQDSAATADHFLTLLDVGVAPTHLALKPDGGEIFVSNFTSDSISEISTWTNEVGGTYAIGSKPSQGVVSRDNSTLWVSNFGADTISLYSVDDGKVVGSLHTGAAPDALAFSADEHLLLAADAHSGDVAVIRTQGKQGPALFTMLPAGASPSAIVVKALQPNK